MGTDIATLQRHISKLENENKALKASHKNELKILESLETLNQIIFTETSLEGVLEHSLRAFLDFFECDRAWLLYPCDPDAATYRIPMEQTRPKWPGAKLEGTDIELDDHARDVFRAAFEAKAPIAYDLKQNSEQLRSEIFTLFHIKSQLAFALTPAEGKSWLLGIHHCEQPKIYDSSDFRLFTALGTRLADGLSKWVASANSRKLFQNSEVSIWNEDLSDVRAALEKLRGKGILDLRTYFSEHPDSAWEIARLVKVIEVNQATLSLFGAENQNEFVTSIDKSFGDDAINVFIDELCSIWDGRASFRSEATFRTFLGEEINAIISFHIPETADEFRSVPINIVDITAQKHLEEQIRRSQKLEAVGQLTGGIAHDFNNILNIVHGNLVLAEAQISGNHELTHLVQKALKGCERATGLTRKLLSFSRKESHEVKLIEVNQFIENLQELIAKSITAAIDVKIQLDCNLWQVEVAPNDLEDALLNLALNARDAMPDGGTLTISSTNSVIEKSQESVTGNPLFGDYVVISISDTGHGMPRSVQERAFEPFFTTKELGKGTGLGLSMVYGFIDRSKGAIKIDSATDRGTKIQLFLPRATSQSVSVDQCEEHLDQMPRGKEIILILDDEPDLVDIAEAYLEDLGYTTYTATSPQQALEILKDHPEIDLVFSDIIMPGELSGYQLANLVRKNHPNTQVLLASGYNAPQPSQNEEIEHHPHPTCVRKPYSQQDLSQAIKLALMARN